MSALHIIPHRDHIDHDLEEDCVCGPAIEFRHPETDEPYQRPVITHHSIDGREHHERSWLRIAWARISRRYWLIADPDLE